MAATTKLSDFVALVSFKANYIYRQGLVCVSSWPRTYYIAKNGHGFLILLPPPSPVYLIPGLLQSKELGKHSTLSHVLIPHEPTEEPIKSDRLLRPKYTVQM